MSAGIQILNDEGYLQIDENYANLVFMGKGVAQVRSVATYPPTPLIRRGSFTLNVGVETPMAFIRPIGVNAQILSITRNDSQVTVTVGCNADADIPVYIFGKIPNDSSGNMGLQVFDANGRITFNSNYKPLRIAQIAKMRDGVLLNGSNYLTMNAPWGVYAAATSFLKIDTVAGYYQPTTTYYSTRYGDAFMVNDTGLTTAAIPVANIPASSTAQSNTGGIYMLVKVDGL